MTIHLPKHVITKEELLKLVEENSPYLSAYYSSSKELQDDFENHYFDHYLLESTRKEIIGVKESSSVSLSLQIEKHFENTFNFVKDLFLYNSNDYLMSVYKTHSLKGNDLRLLIQMARRELAKGLSVKDSLLVRYDCSADMDSGKLKGVYEINSDTPTMLFESVFLQNFIASKEAGDYWQNNEFFTMASEGKLPVKNKLVGVVCNTDYTEDLSTSETVAQLLEQGGNTVFFADISQLNHDVLSINKPFYIDGVSAPMDALYILLPWEEMIASGKDILTHSMNFDVKFMQPAFMWFVGHKMTQALITEAIEEGEYGWSEFVGHIRTYTSPYEFIREGVPYVSKPVIGRFSQNITFHQDGDTTTTEGVYGEERLIYQELIEPTTTPDGKRFIFCPWLMLDEVSGFSFRRFDGIVNDEKQEYFIPHYLIEESEPEHLLLEN